MYHLFSSVDGSSHTPYLHSSVLYGQYLPWGSVEKCGREKFLGRFITHLQWMILFLDALSHLCASLCDGMSVLPSVRWSHTSWIFENSDSLIKMEQNSTKNMKLYHLKNNSEKSTRADRQNAFDVWTLSDLLLQKFT